MSTPVLSPCSNGNTHLLAAPLTPEYNNIDNNSKKPVWIKPSTDDIVDIGPVMDVGSWPSLIESTKYPTKAPPAESSKNPSDSTVLMSQVDDETVNSSPASSTSIHPQKRMTSNPSDPNPNAVQHHGRPTRQRSMKHESGGNSSANGAAFSHQPPLSSPVAESSLDTNVSQKFGNGASDNSRREQGNNNYAYRDGGRRDHPPQRNYGRGYSGPHIRGDGPLGGRRDQDRANPNWTYNRSFNGRGPVVPPQIAAPRDFMRPPPPDVPPYMYPHMQPYNNRFGMPPGMPSPYPYASQPGMPFGRPMPPTGYLPNPQLSVMIIKQIDYYFSNENLIKDVYLRQKMDENGWVPIHVIAGFNKVKELTSNIQLIMDILRNSTVVELQGNKIRKRNEWMTWILTPSVNLSGQAARVQGDSSG